MKIRILVITSIMLCAFNSMAQSIEGIDKVRISQDWEVLVNYVCCKYTSAYISAYNNKKNVSKSEKELFNNEIKPTLDMANVNNKASIRSVEQIKSLLKNKGLLEKYELFFNKFDTLSYDSDKPLTHLLDLSMYTVETRSWLSTTKDELTGELSNLYKKVEHPNSKKNAINGEKNNENKQIQVEIPVWIKIFSVLGFVSLLVTILGFCYVLGIDFRKKITKAVMADGEFKEKLSISHPRHEGNTHNYNNDSYDRKSYEELKCDVAFVKTNLKDIAQKVDSLNMQVSKQNSVVDTTITSGNKKDEHVIKSIDIVYLDNYSDGLLYEKDQSDANFKLYKKDSTNGNFEFCGNPEKAIAQRDATFSDICELTGWTSNVRNIETIEKGQATYVDGKWKVTKLCRIKFS